MQDHREVSNNFSKKLIEYFFGEENKKAVTSCDRLSFGNYFRYDVEK